MMLDLEQRDDTPACGSEAYTLTSSRQSRRRFLGSGCVAGACFGAATSLQLSQTLHAQNTARTLMTDATVEAIEDGLRYLGDHQDRKNGTFGPLGYGHNVAVIGIVGLAFLAHGSTPERGRYSVVVRRCVDYILDHCQPSGFIRARGAGDERPMYGQGFATLFLAEVYGTTDDPRIRQQLSRAVRLIEKVQNAEGGWRYHPQRSDADISVTICQIMALRAARNAGIFVPDTTFERCTQYVKRCQNPNGGFMYMLSEPGDSMFARSAAAVVSLNSAGVYKGPEIDKALAYLSRNEQALFEAAGGSYYFYGHYYAVQAMWHAGGRRWTSWYTQVRDLLLAEQAADGKWVDSIDEANAYATAMACLVLMMPRNYLPIFQR